MDKIHGGVRMAIIKDGMLVYEPMWVGDIPNEPRSYITIWMGHSELYAPGIHRDEGGYIHLPIWGDVCVKAGVRDGQTLKVAMSKLNDYFSEQFLKTAGGKA